ncbi:MAG TPA: HigA family addiction module antitoxin [Acidiferrobacterales bacterium]|jgi:addiction module HigA family antidote
MHERQPFSPGEVLKEEFMDPLNLTQGELAEWLKVERRRINEIIRGKREVTPDTALRLAQAFGVSPMFWLTLQTRFNLWSAQQDKPEEYTAIPPIRGAKK